MAERRRGAVTAIDSGGHRESVRARRDELVMAHLDLVRSIARRIHTSLPPSFDLDDLYAEGYRALVMAATRYRPDAHGGAPFSAYARRVIDGAIRELVCDRPGRSRQNYREATRLPLENAPEQFVVPEAEQDMDRHRRAAALWDAIGRLDDRKAELLRAYYSAEEPSLAAVAIRFGRSTTWVKALRAEALRELRGLLVDLRDTA